MMVGKGAKRGLVVGKSGSSLRNEESNSEGYDLKDGNSASKDAGGSIAGKKKSIDDAAFEDNEDDVGLSASGT